MQLADEFALALLVLAEGEQAVLGEDGLEVGNDFARRDALLVFELCPGLDNLYGEF